MKAYNRQTCESIHIDLETRNVSFLKMAVLLKNAGVSNCCFFLAEHKGQRL